MLPTQIQAEALLITYFEKKARRNIYTIVEKDTFHP